jgi:hypothetical protein
MAEDRRRALLTVRLEAHAMVKAWAEQYCVTVADVLDVMCFELRCNGFKQETIKRLRIAAEECERRRANRASKASLSRRSITKPRRSGGAD